MSSTNTPFTPQTDLLPDIADLWASTTNMEDIKKQRPSMTLRAFRAFNKAAASLTSFAAVTVIAGGFGIAALDKDGVKKDDLIKSATDAYEQVFHPEIIAARKAAEAKRLADLEAARVYEAQQQELAKIAEQYRIAGEARQKAAQEAAAKAEAKRLADLETARVYEAQQQELARIAEQYRIAGAARQKAAAEAEAKRTGVVATCTFPDNKEPSIDDCAIPLSTFAKGQKILAIFKAKAEPAAKTYEIEHNGGATLPTKDTIAQQILARVSKAMGRTSKIEAP